jgi:serine/threonine-protein kinase
VVPPVEEQLAGVRIGQVLVGKYRVERVLGVGGMGAVVAAHHLQLDTKVAIKFLLTHMLAHPDAVTRFAREARAAVKITSEHVGRVLDVGVLETGAPYMVMEYLEGLDLNVWLEQQGPLSIEEGVEFVLQASEAIAEAHSLGIVHRDLKPSNLFCIRRADGKLAIKVLDFGISKVSALPGLSRDLAVTGAAYLLGTPLYMSPEQLEASHAVDARTDIWAVGVILFELLTGRAPFFGETVTEISVKIATRPPPLLRDFRPDAPEGLQAAILTCLEKDRERRYRSMAELALALLPFGPKRAKASVERITDIIQAAGLSATALSVPPSPPPALPAAKETIAPLGRTSAGTSGKRAWIGVLAMLGALLAAAAVAALRYSNRRPETSNVDTAAMRSAARETAEECAPNSTRCSGPTPEQCTGGQWTGGPVTAGQCGAVCTPGSPPKCNGRVPLICTGRGQWRMEEPCPYGCSEGSCTGECVPETVRCAGPDAAQKCGADGRWVAKIAPCTRSSVCRNGVCVESAPHPPDSKVASPLSPVASPASPSQPNCNPPYFIDSSGHREYKRECP